MRKKVIHHFRKHDLVLFSILENNRSFLDLELSRSNNYFRSLCREIIRQQLASKAAHKIFERFLTLFPNKKVAPEYALTISDQKIRDAGPAWSKLRFIKGLAQKIMTREPRFLFLEKVLRK